MRIVHEAVDAGLTLMANAWECHAGRSEEWKGQALRGRRDKVFLMTKVCTHGRDGKVAMQPLEQSLRRLWQVHEVISDNDPALPFAPGGVIEALEQAKRAGKVRFVGFTGHQDPAIHLKMLASNVSFDTCQLPLNSFDASFRSFETAGFLELPRRGIGAIGMQSLGGDGAAVKTGVVTVAEALRYVLSLPMATLVSGMDSVGVLQQNLAIARSFTPMSADEVRALRARVQPMAADGRFEL